MARNKEKPPHRADTRGGGFTGLPHVVQDSTAYRDCGLWARAVLAEIIREFNGYNNGEIVLSVSQFCERLSTTNRGKISRALAELMEHGLIDVAADAIWRQRRAREYRLTFISSGKFPHLRSATNDYRSWDGVKFSGNASLPDGGQSGNASLPEAGRAGNASLPAKFANLRKSAISDKVASASSGNTVSPHIL